MQMQLHRGINIMGVKRAFNVRLLLFSLREKYVEKIAQLNEWLDMDGWKGKS